MLLLTILAVSGMTGIIISLFGLVILRLTLTRRLKKKLKKTDEYWNTGASDFGFINTAVFAWACSIPSFERLERFQALYPNLNVRAFANPFERATAYGILVGAFTFFVCGALFLLLES